MGEEGVVVVIIEMIVETGSRFYYFDTGAGFDFEYLLFRDVKGNIFVRVIVLIVLLLVHIVQIGELSISLVKSLMRFQGRVVLLRMQRRTLTRIIILFLISLPVSMLIQIILRTRILF